MIFGSVSFSVSKSYDSIIDLIRYYINLDNYYHPVRINGFSGGFYLNHSFPLQASDNYYADEQNDIFVLLSGFIYNKDKSLKSLCDPEFIAGKFLSEGSDFVEKLNGDFSFLIYRPANKLCYLYRDHLGIRPMTWSISSDAIFFSSDMLAISRALAKDSDFDTEFLLGYLKYIDYRKTPNRKVYKLLPGHYLKYSSKGIETVRFWKPEKIKVDRQLQYDKIISDLDLLLKDSVSIRFDNRFTAGSHVSGGIDSGIIASLARKCYKDQARFIGFSWSPSPFLIEEEKNDERKLVIELCNKSFIEPMFSEMTTDNFIFRLSSFYRNNGFFSKDCTSDQIVETGTNLIFSGWGGDEFLSTGDRGIELDIIKEFRIKLFLKRNNLMKPFKLFRYLLFFVFYPVIGLLDKATRKSFKDDSLYLKQQFRKSNKRAIADFYFHSSRHQLHLNMLNFYHLQYRCENLSIMGFRKGIEYRYPMLDKRIIEYMLMVPTVLLCKTNVSRPLLRKIGDGIIPESVLLNVDKSDPVYWKWMEGLFCKVGTKIIDEVLEWKSEHTIDFINFDKLEEDIELYRRSEPGKKIDTKVLFRSLIYFKSLYEFSKEYRTFRS